MLNRIRRGWRNYKEDFRRHPSSALGSYVTMALMVTVFGVLVSTAGVSTQTVLISTLIVSGFLFQGFTAEYYYHKIVDKLKK